MLVLILALIIGLFCVLLFMLNYGSLLTGKREAQTAADAAAIQAAKDICSIAVPAGQLGQIGLVNIAANSNDHPASKPELNDGGTGLALNRPIIGINTALANARLRLLIAADLKNDQLRKLAEADLSYLQKNVIPALNDRIAKCTEMNQPVWKDALAIYKQNGERANKGMPIEDQFKVQPGILTSGGTTSIKLPTGSDPAAQAAGGAGNFYLAFKNYPVNSDSVVLSAIGPQPTLVDEKGFDGDASQVGDMQVVRSAIRIVSTDQVTVPATDSKAGSQAKVQTSACAEAGGGVSSSDGGVAFVLQSGPAKSILTIGFAGGIPPADGFPGKILNIDSMSKLSAGSGSPATYPTPNKQTWFQSVSDNSPDGTEDTLLSSKLQYNLAPQRETPGAALCRGVNDWIYSLGAKADRVSLSKALVKDLYIDTMKVIATKACPNPNSIGVTTCMLNVMPDVNSDARYDAIAGIKTALNTDPPANFQTAYNMAFGYTWATVACPQDAAFISYANGQWKLANGQPIGVACDLRRAALETITASRLATRVAQRLVPIEMNAQNNMMYELATGQTNDANYLGARAYWIATVHNLMENNSINKEQEAATVLNNFAALTACGITPNVPFGSAKYGRPQPKSFQFDRFADKNAVFVPCPKFEPQAFSSGVPTATMSWDNACDFATPDGSSDNYSLATQYANQYASAETSNTGGYWSCPDQPKKQHPVSGYDRYIYPGTQMWGPGCAAGYGLYAGNGEGWIDSTNGLADIPINQFVFSMEPYNCKSYGKDAQTGIESGFEPNSSFGNGPISYHKEEPLPSAVLPRQASVIWQFAVDGDYSAGTGGLGAIIIKNSSSPTGDFAFSNNKLLNGQYLYIATNGLVTSSGSGADQTTTYWTVIAKDNGIDRSSLPPINGNLDCFNFRIGCPLADSCCQTLCPDGVKGFPGKTACPDIPPGMY